MQRLPDSYTRYPRATLWLVRGGTAVIGGDDTDAQPRFFAQVEPFYLSKLPITNVQFEAFDPDYVRQPASPGDDDPATGVDYGRARDYCAWYARVSRKAMRLPSEIEWEYACRGGTTGRWFFGERAEMADPYVWHSANSGDGVPPLHRSRPNPSGLHAMLGGVWEWTGSLYRPYPARTGDGRDDPVEAGPRVLRGGSWRSPLERIACAARRAGDPATRADDIGFRVARSLGDR
jgi:formylglycine-generating enzyme required for sulfatase activity